MTRTGLPRIYERENRALQQQTEQQKRRQRGIYKRGRMRQRKMQQISERDRQIVGARKKDH